VSNKISSIKCSSCGAPLDILGGGRVTTITCSYCHSVIDLENEHAVLSKFTKVKRPLAPFSIGMRGNIKGVEWTIIGWVTYRTVEFPSEEWNEFFLYSPTHGYAWLVYEEGDNISLCLRVRDFDLLAWQEKKPRMLFYKKGHFVLDEESYAIYIDYVEGELNWVAKFGDRITCWDYNGVNRQSLTIEKSINELEVYYTQPLKTKDIYHAFSLEYSNKSRTQKGATFTQNEEENETTSTLQKWFLLLPLLIALFMIASLFYHKEIYNTNYHSLTHEANFTISSGAFLSAITLKASDLNSANHQITISQEGKRIFYLDKARVFFDTSHNRSSWRPNAISTTSYIKLPKGTYTLHASKANATSSTSIKIEQQVIRNSYFLPLFIILLLVVILPYMMHHNKSFKIALIATPALIMTIIFGIETMIIFAIIGASFYFQHRANR
jgi:hypothetical protein